MLTQAVDTAVLTFLSLEVSSPIPLPRPLARSTVGGLDALLPPGRAQNARYILHFSHLGAILPHLVADLAYLELSYAHLSPT